MSHLDILLPFSLPPEEMAGDVLRALKAPALALLLSRAGSARRDEFDPFLRALPHEQWLSRQFGLEEETRKRGSPPIAAAMMAMYGLKNQTGTWFLLHPVHLHIARDHLVLTSPRQLTLPEQESRALFDTVKPLFDELGKPLLYGDAHHWFVRADDWDALSTATPDAASGHNIDIWMPQGSAERDWRKLQNEIQMHWHTHPVNEARETRGERTINSVWLWGGATATGNAPSSRYSDLFNLGSWAIALDPAASPQTRRSTPADIVVAAPKLGLIILDDLIEPALAGDWSEWITRLNDLELHWFDPLLNAVKTGKISQISLVATHGTKLAEFIISRNSLRKFWVKPSLSRLAQ